MQRPRVVLVPGFTQTASSWRGVAEVARETCEVIDVDVDVGESFDATARAIGRVGRRAIYVGYSMGGRLCLRLALDRPEIVQGLMLVSTSPGIADPAERATRVETDEVLADAVERDGVDRFLEQWLAQPMFASVPPHAPGLTDRRRLSPQFLAACLRVLGAGAMTPMWNDLARLSMPVMLVTGTHDAKFTTIAQRMLERMHAGVGHVQLEGGHALPLEAPAVLGGLVVAFASQDHR